MSNRTLKIDQGVYIKPLKINGVIKYFENGLVYVTYFDSTGTRKLKKFDPGLLGPYRKLKNKTKHISIKYFTDVEKVAPISKGDWIDLRAAEDISLKQGEFKLIPLGVGMKLPVGYEAQLAPRSSTFKNWGIIQPNSPGVVDNSYSGNEDQWKMPAYATRDTLIKKNDRICQFRIVDSMGTVQINEVDNLDAVSRGGFGTTGVN